MDGRVGECLGKRKRGLEGVGDGLDGSGGCGRSVIEACVWNGKDSIGTAPK